MSFFEAQRDLNARFNYLSDTWDRWRILSGPGPVRGDCEDYALTLIWLAEGRSMLRFWWALFTFKYVIWFCRLRGGHVVLWVRGVGWTDNIQKRPVTRKVLREQGYRLRFPFLAPMVAVKFLIRRVRAVFLEN